MQELRDRITTLRHENEQLRLHVELYEEHIRRLTIENTRLTTELVRHEGVIKPRQPPRRAHPGMTMCCAAARYAERRTWWHGRAARQPVH